MARLVLLLALVPGALSAQPFASPVAQDGPGRGPSVGAVLVSSGATLVGVGAGLAVYSADGRGGLDDPAVLVLAAGLALGPSAGNVWLGESRDALVGTGLRVAGLVAVGLGAAAYDGHDAPGSADVALVGGAALFLSGVTYDAVTQIRNGRAGRTRLGPAVGGFSLTVRL